MADYKVVDAEQLDADLGTVADAIREQTGKTDEIAFPEGFKSAPAELVEVGKKAEYDAFWDEFQQNGNRSDYRYAFRIGWTTGLLRPKYDIAGTSFVSAFATTDIAGDLAYLLDGMGRKLDTSKATDLDSIFYNARKITRLPTIDTSSATNILFMFDTATSVKTIDKVILKRDGSQNPNAFRYMYGLQHLTIEGVIGQNGLNIQWSPLSHDSLMSIINALADKSADTSGTDWLVTIGSANYKKLTDEEIEIAENKGWRLA